MVQGILDMKLGGQEGWVYTYVAWHWILKEH